MSSGITQIKNATRVTINPATAENQTSGEQKIQLVDSSNHSIDSVLDESGNYHLGVATIQDVIADAGNSSTTNLASGNSYTFTGTATTTLGVAAIQVSLKTDKNATVYIEQSPDGTNWDISDSYNYYYSLNNFGLTVQAINSYARVRVVLTGTTATTYFRLQTALCPIAEPLPRALDADGNLKTVIEKIEDVYGFEVENTPMGEMRVATPYKLVGSVFTGTTVDTNFWTSTLGTGGTAAQGNSQLILSTGTTANNTTSFVSTRRARYNGGSALRFRTVIRLPDVGTANNVRRWGAFDANDGAFFELSGTTLKIVTRKGTTDTAISNGSFNGLLGATITVDTNVHTYEIYWTNSSVWFVIDDKLIHKVSATTTTWADTMSHIIRFENNNSGDSSTNVAMNIRVATIYRLGELLTQPTSKYQSGTTAGLILKYGAGNLHGLVVSGVANTSAITLYDNTAASGTVIWSSGAMGAQTQPFDIHFMGLPFSIGLTLVIATANCNVTTIYE